MLLHGAMSSKAPSREERTRGDESPYLTQDEAAGIARVCRKTVERWREDELFLSVRPIRRGSGRVLIDKASFLAFLGVEIGA